MTRKETARSKEDIERNRHMSGIRTPMEWSDVEIEKLPYGMSEEENQKQYDNFDLLEEHYGHALKWERTHWIVKSGNYIYPVGTRVRTFKIVCEECSKYIGHNGDILEGIKTETEDFELGSHDNYEVVSPRQARNMDQEQLDSSIKNGTTRIRC